MYKALQDDILDFIRHAQAVSINLYPALIKKIVSFTLCLVLHVLHVYAYEASPVERLVSCNAHGFPEHAIYDNTFLITAFD